jgi:hypothetical protein
MPVRLANKRLRSFFSRSVGLGLELLGRQAPVRPWILLVSRKRTYKTICGITVYDVPAHLASDGRGWHHAAWAAGTHAMWCAGLFNSPDWFHRVMQAGLTEELLIRDGRVHVADFFLGHYLNSLIVRSLSFQAALSLAALNDDEARELGRSSHLQAIGAMLVRLGGSDALAELAEASDVEIIRYAMSRGIDVSEPIESLVERILWKSAGGRPPAEWSAGPL